MKIMSQIVSGGGWKGTRVERIRVKAWITLLLAGGLGCISIISIGSVLFYACIPAVVSLIASGVLFIREQPLQFESFSHRVGADPRKLYGRCGGSDMKTIRRNAEQSGRGDGDKPSD